jgi:hypothetical protein
MTIPGIAHKNAIHVITFSVPPYFKDVFAHLTGDSSNLGVEVVFVLTDEAGGFDSVASHVRLYVCQLYVLS